MNWYLKVLKNYANFNGRARRTEYWMFFLFNIIFSVTAIFLDNIFDLARPKTIYGTIYLAYFLALLIPSISVIVRRLHDTGKNGYWVLMIFIPAIGVIWLFVMLVTEGNAGRNNYGPDPKRDQEMFIA